MQRLVEVGPRHGNEILDTARHRSPYIVNDAQHRITVLHRPGDDAHGIKVINLVDVNTLAHQLFVDAVIALGTTFHFCGDAGFLKLVADHAFYARQERFAHFAVRFHRFLYLLVSDGIEVAESEVFEFAADFAHAQAVRNGTVNLEGFLGDLLLAFGFEMLQGAHVVQAVGQFDEHHADIVHHGEHHLAQVLGLLLFLGGEINFADLGNAFDDMGDLLAKLLADVDDGDRGVFDRIVEQPGGDGDRVHLHFRQHQGNFEGMDQVGLARGAALAGMDSQGVVVGFLDDFQIFGGPVGLHALHQVTELRDREDIGRDLLAQSRHGGL